MSIIQDILQTQEFATLPTLVSRLLNLIADDNVDTREISSVIETDASLTLKILRVSNSPLYATRSEITSINQAILNLGLNRLTNIVLGVSIFSKFLMGSRKNIAQLMQKFWWHTSCTGMVAKSLAVQLDLNFKENEFIGGLLHDIGKLAMLQYDSERFNEVIALVENGDVDVIAEKKIYGVDHTEIGTEIARLWKLPNDLQNIIAFHTRPEESLESQELISVVRVADLLTEIWDAGFYEGLKYISIEESPAWKILMNHLANAEKTDFEILTFELEQDFKKSKEFLSIISS